MSEITIDEIIKDLTRKSLILDGEKEEEDTEEKKEIKDSLSATNRKE